MGEQEGSEEVRKQKLKLNTISPRVHSAFFPLGTRKIFAGGKAAWARSSQLISV